MADLEGSTIAATYRSLLNVGTADNAELHATTLKVIEDGAGNNSCLYLAEQKFLVKSATDIDATFDVQNSSGHQLLTIDTVSNPEEVIVNEGGLTTVDFRVEGSSSNTNLLFCDASSNRVGINTSSPKQMLEVASAGSASSVLQVTAYDADSTGTQGIIRLAKSKSNDVGTLVQTNSGESLGQVDYYGVNDSSALTRAAAIGCKHAGTDHATYVGGELFFQTSTGAAAVATRMTIDKDGKVGIGIGAPEYHLHVYSASANAPTLLLDHVSTGLEGPNIILRNKDSNSVLANDTILGDITFKGYDGTDSYVTAAFIRCKTEGAGGGDDTLAADLSFHTSAGSGTSAAITIDKDQNVGIGTGAPGNPLAVNRSGDGVIVDFESANAVEGTVSIASATTSYNAFVGSHYTQLKDGQSDLPIGSVVISTGEIITCNFVSKAIDAVAAVEAKDAVLDGDGNIIEEAIEAVEAIAAVPATTTNVQNKEYFTYINTTTTASNPSVYGTWMGKMSDDAKGHSFGDDNKPIYLVAQVGLYKIRVTDTNGNISNGDYLESSTRGMEGQKQTSSAKVNSTIGKAMVDVDWSSVDTDSDLGYKWKLIPCTF